MRRITAFLSLFLFTASLVNAQLSSNPDKFLGNITTSYNVDYGSEKYYTLWNQITCENETKWGSVEGSRRGSFNWNDAAYNYAKSHNFPFKFHTLVWGSQYPGWMDNLSPEDQYDAIVEWFDEAKRHYPDLEIIDVVNEAVPGHAPAPYKNALGGDGVTGYDWIIEAFELAYERWPDAILIYNDYNTFQWQKTQFIDLVRTLRDAGAPIDAYGCQSHDLTDMNFNDFKSAMTEIQNELKMPMYSTEYDIGTTDDDKQYQQYKDQIKYMWESDYCAGITLWGYIYGKTWTTDGNSGIIRVENNQNVDRPAMTWLREYMSTNEARNAKSPFPGMKKEASIYIKPASIRVTKLDTVPITVRASMRTKSIDSIKLYVNNKLTETMTTTPYVTRYVPKTTGKYNLKAVVYANDGTRYERLAGFTAYNPRKPHKTMNLPGTIQAEDFDEGPEGIAYHDSNSDSEGDASGYRSDGSGVDIVQGNGGYAIGYTSTGEWMEYTVNVNEAGVYTYTAYVSSGVNSSSFSLSLSNNGTLTDLTGTLNVPQTGDNNWSNYTTMSGRLKVALKEGKNIIRLNINGSSCNIDKIVFSKIEYNGNIRLSISADPAIANMNTVVRVDVSSPVEIANVKFYQGEKLLGTATQTPYQVNYRPSQRGTFTFQAVATDVNGAQSDIVTYTLKVTAPFSGTPIIIPGIIEIEDFDKGGDGFSFHDSDSDDEGDANYRTDNGGVDIKSRSGRIVIGNTADGEWLEYTVNVEQAGKYLYSTVVSSGVTNSGYQIGVVSNGNVRNLCKVSVPQTGDNSWSNYVPVEGTLGYLEAGLQVLRVSVDGAYFNIDNIELSLDPTSVRYVTPDDYKANGTRYNIGGSVVGSGYKGIVIIDGKKVLQR